MKKPKHLWMPPHQISLYEDLCKEFGFKRLTDIGAFLELKSPYHGAKLIFESQKQNKYLKKLLSEKKRDNEKISKLTAEIENINKFKAKIGEAEDNLQTSLETLLFIKKSMQ